jgi:four helix bundle protein
MVPHRWRAWGGAVGFVGGVGIVGILGLAGRYKLCSASSMPLRHHTLIAWQRADDLFISLHQVVKESFPPDERDELSTQLRRAAYSVAANIVEGFAREHRAERAQFLNIAWGSLAEVGYCLHVARRLDYLNERRYEQLEIQVRQVGAPLSGLIRNAKKG